jgi:hypothetical protein
VVVRLQREIEDATRANLEALGEIVRLRAQLAAVATSEWDRISRERDEALAANERIKEACWIFRTYGLPPNDVSGRAEWDRALLLLVGGKP